MNPSKTSGIERRLIIGLIEMSKQFRYGDEYVQGSVSSHQIANANVKKDLYVLFCFRTIVAVHPS